MQWQDFLSVLAIVNESPRKSDLGPVKQGGSFLPRVGFRIDIKGTEWFCYDLQVVHSGKEIKQERLQKRERNNNK